MPTRHQQKVSLKRRKKDHDQVHRDMREGVHLVPDIELPGMGRHFCIPCERYFINDTDLTKHKRTSKHKRKVKLMKDEPHTQAHAEAVVGLSTAK
ncbi:MAG: hypothetical protein KVP17_004754 [Porospora cf. gigantea B]|uniref:uncharacterized protein n=1 Tax=Porospora cf. gigantea B TaxID=2853592 RepID=UPI0035719651|nr:MAG: hypothetical protein KVP17_004754 [Porospora cf. gigantea B]